MAAIIELYHVSVYYGKKKALSDICLKIPKGQIMAVIGPSGCGKSTLLRSICGSLRGESGVRIEGKITFDRVPAESLPQDELRRRIGLVFQTPTPFPFSVYRNMIYAPRYYGVRDKEKLRQIAEEKLRLTGLYDEVKNNLEQSALRLSGGQQQRLCIARALTANPEVLLLDEPCSALDVKAGAVIEDLLLRLRERYTIVIVTHNIGQAKRIADQAVFLSEGRLVEQGEKNAFFSQPQCEETREFLSYG